MTTIEALKSQAKRLRAHLSTNNIPFAHSQSLEAVAIMHGYRDWNTATAACSKAAELLNEPKSPLLVFVTPETSPDELRVDVQNQLRRAPKTIRFRLDAGITFEQARFARSLATELEQKGIEVEFDSPV